MNEIEIMGHTDQRMWGGDEVKGGKRKMTSLFNTITLKTGQWP